METQWSELEHDGALVGRYQVYRSTPPTADLFEGVGPREGTVAGVLAHLGGWQVATEDDALADALVAAGGVQQRHSHVMSRAVAATDMPAEWTLPWQLDALVATTTFGPEVVPLFRRAYPPGHVDEEKGTDEEIVGDVHARLRGERMGPIHPGSAVVRDAGTPVGLIIVNRVPGSPPLAGPWVSDVCRDPDPRYRGVGGALLERAIGVVARHGEPALSLAVTVGNPAQRLYEQLGFVVAVTSRKILVPDPVH